MKLQFLIKHIKIKLFRLFFIICHHHNKLNNFQDVLQQLKIV